MRTLIPLVLLISGCAGSEALQRIEHVRSVMCNRDAIAAVQAFVEHACSTPDAPPECPTFRQHVAELPKLCAVEID